MPTRVIVDMVWVLPQEGCPPFLPTIIHTMTNGAPQQIDFSAGSHAYRATEMEWDGANQLFSGVIYRKRSRNLPSLLPEVGAEPIELDEDSSLGEPMCFVFSGRLEVAAVQYTHIGARYPRLADLINQMGYGSPIDVSPVLRRDAAARLHHTNFVRKLEMTIRQPSEAVEQLAEGEGVGGAIQLLDDLGGVNVSISVSVGRTGGSLLVDRVKRIGAKVAAFGDAVSKLQIQASPDEDEPFRPIDLLMERLRPSIQVEDRGREMDRDVCKLHLRDTLERHAARLQEQRGDENG